MTYETVIGLEVHIELKTQSKMFCRCRNVSLCEEPNQNICPVCMGVVGALPLINKKAVESTVFIGLALGCHIAARTKWDRKNYFYPDLPKAYQISQFDAPVCFQGKVNILNKDGKVVSIRINRAHLEEDAAKLIHHEKETWVDFNRSGLPLIEIVTEPDIRSIDEAEALLRELRRIVRYLDVSDADMEKGQLRCDASISLRPLGEEKLYPRVEIKNLNSFKMVAKALSYEQNRLEKLWANSEEPKEATTVLWDDEKGETRFMRDKESAADYRYVPEPDVPELAIEARFVEELRKTLPDLPFERMQLFIQNGVDYTTAESIVEDVKNADFLYTLIDLAQDDDELRALLVKKFLGKTGEISVTVDDFFELVQALHSGKISGLQYKEILGSDSVVRGLKAALERSSSVDISTAVLEVLAEHPSVVEEYKQGKEKAINVLIGKLVQKTEGLVAVPVLLEELKGHLDQSKTHSKQWIQPEQ